MSAAKFPAVVFCRTRFSYFLRDPQYLIFNGTVRHFANGSLPVTKVIRESHAEDQIIRLVLNNPSRRNALSIDTMDTLLQSLREIEKMDQARVIILAAEGPVFSSGHNLKELMADEGPDRHREVFSKCIELMEQIQTMPLPVITEVDGLVTAAGTQLVASTDLVIASEKSSFVCPGVKIGLFCSTPGIPLARNLPRKIALDMLLTARALEAHEALKAGLISRVVPSDRVRDEAFHVANTIVSFSKSVIALGKSFFYTQIEQNIHTANRNGIATMCENLKYKDAQEGINAFFYKRQPIWTNNSSK